jgi:hypothetical protein
MELDHVFITCTPGAPEGDVLVQAGFVEGSRNTHAGQGTSNRRFFFRNAYLELLWIHDAQEARSERTRPTRLWERCGERVSTACRFGLVFRPAYEDERPPFPTWSYHPAYLPPSTSIEFAQGTSIAEPELIYLPFARADGLARQATAHPVGIHDMDAVRIGMPALDALTCASHAAQRSGWVSYFTADEPLLVLTTPDLGARVVDLRPVLPLRFSGASD